MKTGKTLVELATELQRRADAKTDFVANTENLYIEPDGRTLEVSPDRGDKVSYPVTSHTARQIATWAGVPAKYADKMREFAPDLLAINFNHWLHQTPARRMIRTLDGSARAFLSDRYRRIDNEDVAEAALPVLMESQDIRIKSCEVTESRLYLKAVFPRLEAEVKVGDPVQAGVLISNSEIGLGALSVQPLVFRLVCSNGMVQNDSGLSRYHVGRRVDGDGKDVAQLFKDDTIKADDTALMLKLRDVIRASACEAQFGELVSRMREATKGPQIQAAQPAVEILGKTLGLQQREKHSVLENLIRGGDYSRWGALNAVTSIANDTEDYDRASELESLGGSVLDLPASQWKQVAEAA